MNDCKDCSVAIDVAELRNEFNEYKRVATETISNQLNEINELKAAFREQSVDYAWMKDAIKEIRDSIKEISLEIRGMKEKPGERWGEVVKTMITVAAGAFAMWLIKGKVE